MTQRAYTVSCNHLVPVAAFPPIRRLLSITMLSFDARSMIHCPTLRTGSVPQTFMYFYLHLYRNSTYYPPPPHTHTHTQRVNLCNIIDEWTKNTRSILQKGNTHHRQRIPMNIGLLKRSFRVTASWRLNKMLGARLELRHRMLHVWTVIDSLENFRCRTNHFISIPYSRFHWLDVTDFCDLCFEL